MEVPFPEEDIVVEKLSGKDFKRPHYRRLVRTLRPEDVLAVKSIDRLGCNCTEILDQRSFVTQKREAANACAMPKATFHDAALRAEAAVEQV